MVKRCIEVVFIKIYLAKVSWKHFFFFHLVVDLA